MNKIKKGAIAIDYNPFLLDKPDQSFQDYLSKQ